MKTRKIIQVHDGSLCLEFFTKDGYANPMPIGAIAVCRTPNGTCRCGHSVADVIDVVRELYPNFGVDEASLKVLLTNEFPEAVA